MSGAKVSDSRGPTSDPSPFNQCRKYAKNGGTAAAHIKCLFSSARFLVCDGRVTAARRRPETDRCVKPPPPDRDGPPLLTLVFLLGLVFVSSVDSEKRTKL